MNRADADALEFVRRNAVPMSGGGRDDDRLLARIGDARLVLLGEATHGTHEFYDARARITKRLILEKGFHAVAIEGDWPDAYEVDAYVRGRSEATDADVALSGFKRFPTWMWRNADVLDFVSWLRQHNDESERKVGFYGLDLYSLYASIEAVVAHLDSVDPEAARRARARYGCFDHYGRDTGRYAYATALGLSQSCERDVLDQLLELRERAEESLLRGGRAGDDEEFFVERNAVLIKNAERYYRSMFRGHVETWNMRDEHMMDTLSALLAHLDKRHGRSKVVVWEHNSHLGDARATDMGASGERNVGQLVRERHGEDAVLVGFTTFDGTVTAASAWDEPAQRKIVRPALPGSYEALFHEASIGRFTLLLDREPGRSAPLFRPRLERAIGVLYMPKTERWSHYFHATLPMQFDAVIHYDRTRAVEPLEVGESWTEGEVPETYPFAV